MRNTPSLSPSRLTQAIDALARDFPGPGGACAVVQEGRVLERHAWGFANAERRIAFTPHTLFRMCSITKQFTCGLVLDSFADPAELDPDVRRHLPLLEGAAPAALHLCHNQSGLRDYWAVAMLHGSPVEAPFGEAEAARVIGGTRTLQFGPGTRYAYCNQNFRLLSNILQDRTGRGFGELLRARLFDAAGMPTAFLAEDTSAMPDGTVGYEGSHATGFRPAENRILWTGDAGLGASLDDMIAWEKFIDDTRDDPLGLYNRLSAPVSFADGAPAAYGFGLARSRPSGRAATGHGGALRGWRSHRVHVASARLSVVVLFNHLSDAHAAAFRVLAAALGEPPEPDPAPVAMPDWLGAYIDPETRLCVRAEDAGGGRIRLRYANPPETLVAAPDGSARNDAVRMEPGEGDLRMHRPTSNQNSRLERCPGGTTSDIAGRYYCAELDSELTVTRTGAALYGGFSGFLGQGRMELLDAVGGDAWVLPCHRALDQTPPGDWTLLFTAGEDGRAARVEVGCLIARRLTYHRIK
jgi:D-aminopeptidase